jgi:hypothetical protein
MFDSKYVWLHLEHWRCQSCLKLALEHPDMYGLKLSMAVSYVISVGYFSVTDLTSLTSSCPRPRLILVLL